MFSAPLSWATPRAEGIPERTEHGALHTAIGTRAGGWHTDDCKCLEPPNTLGLQRLRSFLLQRQLPGGKGVTVERPDRWEGIRAQGTLCWEAAEESRQDGEGWG